MKAAASISVLAFIATSALATDLSQPANVGISPVHARLNVAHSKMRRQAGGKVFKRCKAHNKSGDGSPATTSYAAPAPSSTPYQEPAATTPAPSTGGGSGGGNSGDVINVKTSGCGDIGAVSKTTQTAGPNGSEAWLTCGIEGGGWTPPYVTVGDLKYKDLSFDGIFKPCAQFSSIIFDAAGAYTLPPIMIASIMMQESSCNKETVGGGGEQGLMQLTKDKCGSAPGGNCKDPSYNIHTGSKYLSDQIKASGGNVLLATGSYNGWYEKLTYAGATAAAKTDCCRCMNNLDYLHQFFNGWMQGIDSYSSNLGTYKNLEQCGPY